MVVTVYPVFHLTLALVIMFSLFVYVNRKRICWSCAFRLIILFVCLLFVVYSLFSLCHHLIESARDFMLNDILQ